MVMKKDLTTIPLERKTREILKRFGRKGETYNDIVKKLIRYMEKQRFMQTQYEKLREKEKFIPLEEIE